MPFLLGLPALMKFIGTLPALLVAFVATKVAARAARIALVFGVFMGLFWGLRTTLFSIVGELYRVIPYELYYGMQLIIPENAATTFSAILGAKAAMLIFDAKMHALRYLER